ncbi:MAG: YqaE/Pmp3 family membrane protein [Humidesulfovibrio sp.]|uniref:YqaE/Pmp3 family membrane protein n=1 Tax=Humidesulfovibrio sp. TaxID=2910988 RepID=UPI0027F38EEC|nr:YqaE/Pmp3 family membrane protein [Humidesulfovibrio sp.]MDQ7834627.1 YqaE/Pmp3 family membrane protein [Humidesulfovibrio sp.]
MRLLLAILNPWFAFAGLDRFGTALACLLLQLTLVGWIPAAAWAFYAVRQAAARPRPRVLRPFNIIPKDFTPQKATAS